MVKNITLSDKIYSILLKYFKGSIAMLNKKDLEDLSKGKFNGKDVQNIDEKTIKELKKILRARDKYGINPTLPDWNDNPKLVKENLKKYLPDNEESGKDDEEELDKEDTDEPFYPFPDDKGDNENNKEAKEHTDLTVSDHEFKKEKEILLKQIWTLKTLSKKIEQLKDKDSKSPEENKLLKELEGINVKTNIQLKNIPSKLKDNLQFNFISSFSTTEFNIADEMSEFILKTTKQKIRKNNEGKLSNLSIVDATSCIGGNTLSFAKYFIRVDSIEIDKDNYKILKHNIKVSQKLHELYTPSLKGKINSYLGDYKDILPDIKHNDIIFFDPPWGDDYDIKNPKMPMLGDHTVPEFIDKVCDQFNHVFVKLPPNLDLGDFKIDAKYVPKNKKMKLIYRNCQQKVKEIKDNKVDEHIEYEYKYVLSQRKAYVKWINNEFYNKLIANADESIFKNYQLFVKGYLSLETPFRGLLVYHGLGTGKTATAVITTEGLSHMRINTLLPKSLKDNFINEIKEWGGDIYNIDNSNWAFYDYEENKKIIDNYLLEEYDLKNDKDDGFIKKIHKHTLKKLKDDISESVKDIKDEKERKLKIKYLLHQSATGVKRGLFIKIDDEFKEGVEILTVDGELKPNKHIKAYDNIKQLSDIQKLQLKIQMNNIILNKYNFIHSNALPTITEEQLNHFDIKDDVAIKILQDDGKNPTDRQKLMNNLVEKYKENKKLGIFSPFHNEVIIIDEVHNLISQITNNRGPSLIFYDWITNSVDTKIIFLSGTPIINEPSEIAYLFNMLKGKQQVYEFTLKMTGDIDEITNKLKEIFYNNISCVEQLYVRKYKGKIIVSFIKTKSNFANILDDDGNVKTLKYNDYSFNEFMKQIYIGLHKFIDKKLISPNEKEFKAIDKKELKYITDGKQKIFDEDSGIIFNKHHKLFEIYNDEEQLIDLSNNMEFMDYFFDEDYNIPPRKQVLLRRMLMGLTSYYPIDRSAISFMPEIVDPTMNIIEYNDYNITKKINLVPCQMSYEQFNEYEVKFNKETEEDIKKFSKKTIFEDEYFHYYGGTRQTCNIIYNVEGNTKLKYTLMNQDKNFSDNLSTYSPKMFNVVKNMEKFIKDDKPTGKVLLYSVYRNDGGSGAFEQVLINLGYEKYDYESNHIDDLIKTNSKKKRYTFISGEAEDNNEENKKAYNNADNISGEYIQIMIISQSGAEGISLTCVRQVHILEPYWNNVRMDQVFGRAIRRDSHIGPDKSNPWLPKDKQNVEQYLYLALFPEGGNIKQIFDSIKSQEWDIVKDITHQENFEQYLLDNHKNVYVMIQKILNIKSSSKNGTSDEMLFNIMERKYNITEKLNDIIKESSVDCLKHTTDNPILNSKCIQFTSKLENEMAYFPGIDSNELNQIDTMQLKAQSEPHFIEPDNIVVPTTNSTDNIFSYYKINEKYKDEDIRYIKENGKIVCDFFYDENKFFVYENEKFSLNSKITNKFSVVQSIYHIPFDDDIYDQKISKKQFPSIESISYNRFLVGYKIKYNVNDKLFFSPKNKHDLDIYKLYDYKTYLDNNYTISDKDSFFIIHNNDFYESD